MKYQVVLIQMSEDKRQYLAEKVVYEGDNQKHARGMEYYLNSNDIMEHEGFKYTFAEFREVNAPEYIPTCLR